MSEPKVEGETGVAAEMELRRHFQGRRDGGRVKARIAVELVCVERNLSAKTINLSRSGALLEITDEREDRGEAEILAFCTEIARLFAAGGTVDFRCGITRTAEAVRVTAGGLGGRTAPVVACRFKEPLAADDFLTLGFASPPDEDGATGDQPGDDGDGEAEDFAPEPAGGAERNVPRIHELLRWTVDLKATDLHIRAGSPPRLRVDAVLHAVGDARVESEDAERMARFFLTAEEWEEFERTGDLDVAYELPGVARFRINVLRSRRGVGLVLRRVPEVVPRLEELDLSPVCATFASLRRGLVLVTGGSGSGKSTTLAAMVRRINETRPCHIVTMEDPVEFMHEEAEAQITQREIGHDTENFAAGLKRVLRQDPDVILVGEMRDLETMKLAVTAAETGHLVFATLHTTSAAQTVDRIVDVFPSEQQRQIRLQLASTLQGIICQVLVPRAESGVCVAQEVLVASDAVRSLIREGKTPQVNNVIQTSGEEGMQSLEAALNQLVAAGTITADVARDYANCPEQIREGAPPSRRPVAPPPERASMVR